MGCDLLTYTLKHFARDLKVAGSAHSARELNDVVEKVQPEVAVISLDLEDGLGTGLLAIRSLHSRYPELAIVALMDEHGRHLIGDAFRAGARGVVFRSEPAVRLVDSLRCVHGGNVWASAAELEQMMSAPIAPSPVRMLTASGDELLTERQKSIVALVVEGMHNREIAQQLNLSEHTVKNYLFRIFDKLGVSSRAELIIYALHQNRVA